MRDTATNQEKRKKKEEATIKNKNRRHVLMILLHLCFISMFPKRWRYRWWWWRMVATACYYVPWLMHHTPCTFHIAHCTHTHRFPLHSCRQSAFKHLHAKICNFIVYFILFRIIINLFAFAFDIIPILNVLLLFIFQLKVETCICYNVECWIPIFDSIGLNWIGLDCILCMFFIFHSRSHRSLRKNYLNWIYIQIEMKNNRQFFMDEEMISSNVKFTQCIQTIGLTIETWNLIMYNDLKIMHKWSTDERMNVFWCNVLSSAENVCVYFLRNFSRNCLNGKGHLPQIRYTINLNGHFWSLMPINQAKWMKRKKKKNKNKNRMIVLNMQINMLLLIAHDEHEIVATWLRAAFLMNWRNFSYIRQTVDDYILSFCSLFCFFWWGRLLWIDRWFVFLIDFPDKKSKSLLCKMTN